MVLNALGNLLWFSRQPVPTLWGFETSLEKKCIVGLDKLFPLDHKLTCYDHDVFKYIDYFNSIVVQVTLNKSYLQTKVF